MCICHCSCDYACSEHGYAQHLDTGVSLPPSEAYKHRGHATAAPKDDVDRNRDVVTERKVVEEVDGKEEGDVGEPPN